MSKLDLAALVSALAFVPSDQLVSVVVATGMLTVLATACRCALLRVASLAERERIAAELQQRKVKR